MKAAFSSACAIFMAVALAGCSTLGIGGGREGGGIEVTRTHLGQAVARGQIAIEAFDPADANAAEFGSYAASVQRQLGRLGWTVADSVGQSEQVALVDVQQTATGLTLDVRIKRRSDGSVFWEGKAAGAGLAAGSAAERTAAVERLAEALFRDFPGESGRTIRIR
ncbi:MAG: hypothetical protein JWL74_1839 [Alphaproteobacteria bacterium]|jgi:hypothetical protein|nr:hypothetical protein [Alphaproteobacteria bacterium]